MKKKKLSKLKNKRCTTWFVTGTWHGSIYTCDTEGEARKLFHKHFNGESIVNIYNNITRNIKEWDMY